MNNAITPIAEWCSSTIELLGVLTITAASVYALGLAAWQRLRLDTHQPGATEAWFHDMRQRLGRGILFGLELLVAADIIDTVAVELTIESVGVLALIILIRTFLSFTLEVELTGRWPWQEAAVARADNVPRQRQRRKRPAPHQPEQPE